MVKVPKEKTEPRTKQVRRHENIAKGLTGDGKPRKQRKEKVSLKNMTTDEIRIHKNKIKTDCIKRKKESLDWVEPIRTPEQIAHRKKYANEYHARKKNDPEYMEKRAKHIKNYREKKKDDSRGNLVSS